jgi:multisubunit Na+/H+ antiporter MnhC subunit
MTTVIAMSIILVGVALMVTTTGKGKQEKTVGDEERQDKEIQK